MSVSIGDSIQNLELLRVELYGKVEDSVIERLDREIESLAELQLNAQLDFGKAIEILRLVAQVAASIPSVARAMESLVGIACDAAGH